MAHRRFHRAPEGPDGDFSRGAARHGWPGWGPPPPFGAGRRGRGGGFAGRVRRGDVRAAVLVLLSERPMHGYEIIQELSERTNGAWRPSPGSIYPTLQLLEDEGLVVSEEDAGKRRYSLTESGTAFVAARAGQPEPWAAVRDSVDPDAFALREATGTLLAAVNQVVRAGSPEQQGEAAQLLDEVRRKLYALLAGDSSSAS